MSWISDKWLALLAWPAEIVGIIGMGCIIYAYLALERGWLLREDWRLYVVNLAGALLLLLSLLVHFNLGSFILEFFWIYISIEGLKRTLRSFH